MLADAGFGDVAVHDAPDPFNAVYVTHAWDGSMIERGR
jgi:hypothetical protein